MDDGRALTDEIGRTTEADNRSADDEVREAMALLELLPPVARRSLRSISRLGTAEERTALGNAVGRLIVQHGFDVARRSMADAMREAYPGDWPATEEEIAEEAVRLVREARARLARP